MVNIGDILISRDGDSETVLKVLGIADNKISYQLYEEVVEKDKKCYKETDETDEEYLETFFQTAWENYVS